VDPRRTIWFRRAPGKHLLAFADHAAEFYPGSGNDHRRALELARVEATNRPTRRAIKQADAMEAGEAAPASDLHDANLAK
jgi:hypothetical protein